MDPFTISIIVFFSTFTVLTSLNSITNCLSDNSIKNLFYINKKINKKNLHKYHDDICSICYEGYEVKQKVTELYCKHIYHKKCLYDWLRTDQNYRCPLCNLPLLSKENIRINVYIENLQNN